MLRPAVPLRCLSLIAAIRLRKLSRFLTADETCVLQIRFFLLLLASEIGERIDNDTKYQIQNDNDNYEEE